MLGLKACPAMPSLKEIPGDCLLKGLQARNLGSHKYCDVSMSSELCKSDLEIMKARSKIIQYLWKFVHAHK